MKPDAFNDISAVIALYRPGPMGANSHINYAQRKNGLQPIEYLHPELAEALEPVLGETYGLIVYQEQVVEIACQLAGYTHGLGRPAPQGDGQEEEGRARRRVRGLREGHAGQGILARLDQGTVGHAGPVLRLRLQQGTHGDVRPAGLLDRVPEGALPHRVHGGAAHVGAGRQGQDGGVPQRLPSPRYQRAATGRQRVGGGVHPDRQGHPVRADGRPQRRRQRGRGNRRAPARRRARSPTSPTSSRRCRSR